MPVKYSIIVPCYNVAEYVDDCVRSLTSLTYDPSSYEIIAVDDGSSDDTMEHLKRWEAKYDNITVIHQDNLGLGGARNTGLLHAKGEWILYVDSDDWINATNLLEILDTLTTDDVDVIKSITNKTVNNRANLELSEIQYNDNPTYYVGEELLKAGKFTPNVWLGCYRCSFLERMNYPFREHVAYEDTDWTTMVYLTAKRIAIIDLPFYSYYNRPNSLSNNPNIKRFADALAGSINLDNIYRIIPIQKSLLNHLRTNLKKSTLKSILIARNYKIKDAVRVFNTAKLQGLLDIDDYQMSKPERIWLFCLKHFSSPIIATIRTATLLKRIIKQ